MKFPGSENAEGDAYSWAHKYHAFTAID